MASKRPYFSSTGPQLQNLFEANRNDTKVLRDLLAELKHRSTPTAHALKWRKRSLPFNQQGAPQGVVKSPSKLLPRHRLPHPAITC
jgi:hypothetical protein